jgi:hypothetical protein
MVVFMENTIVLTDAERMELNQRAASRSGRADADRNSAFAGHEIFVRKLTGRQSESLLIAFFAENST